AGNVCVPVCRMADWHTIGTVNCVNQNRPRKSLDFKDLRGHHL
ncbi:MAG: hypothetical protein ACI93T_004814, partial [Porticoccaceae bacterium]